MPTPSVLDQPAIQNALHKQYASKRIEEQKIFHQGCDALFAEMKTKEVNMNGGAGFILQMFARGSNQGPNRQWSKRGQGAPVFRQITMSTKDIEDGFGWTRNAMQDAVDAGGPKGGFNLAKLHIDQCLRLMAQNIGQLMESDGFGTLAYVSSVTSTTKFVAGDGSAVTNPARANRFYIGQVLVFAAAAMTGEIRSSGASLATVYTHTVSAIDILTGEITVSANLTTSGVTAGDAVSTFGYREFDATASGASVFFGLDAWAPTTAIGASDPLGRNGKPDLQPIVIDVTGATIIEAIGTIDKIAFDNGVRVGSKFYVPSHVFQSLNLGAMRGQVVETRTTRKGGDGEYTIAYNKFTYAGMRGPIDIVPSAHTSVARWFDPDIFRVAYVGDGLVNIHKPDGKTYRLANESGVTDSAGNAQSGFTGEAFSRLQLLCDAPGDIIVAKGLKE